MFDDFIVKDDKEEVVADSHPEVSEIFINTKDVEEPVIETISETAEEVVEEVVEEVQDKKEDETVKQDPQQYDYVNALTVQENLAVYTEEELQEEIKHAKEEAYNKGLEEAKNSLEEKQNILLEDIKNQLMTIFASLDEKKSDMERGTLNFSVSLVKKILPTLEKERAEQEVKSFLAENFANFASQEALSFSFNPEIISQVADSIGRLAEQNDFEGKISVHKDVSLGLSDCRVEWKSGGVERKTSNILNKVENLININDQERENGQ
jgi:flagellar assembly protein FliH